MRIFSLKANSSLPNYRLYRNKCQGFHVWFLFKENLKFIQHEKHTISFNI